MRRRSICAVAVLAMLLLIFTSLAPSQAADYSKLGVRQYDVATYSHSSSDPFSATSVGVTVNTVSGVLVSLTWSWRDLNWDYTINVTSGTNMDPMSSLKNSWFFMVAANLSAGDIVATSYPRYWFNETLNNYYVAGKNWTANHISMMNASYVLDAYFDKPTGWMLKWYVDYPAISTWDNFALTSLVNIPGSFSETYPVDWVLAIAISTLILVLAVVFILNRRAQLGRRVAGSGRT